MMTDTVKAARPLKHPPAAVVPPQGTAAPSPHASFVRRWLTTLVEAIGCAPRSLRASAAGGPTSFDRNPLAAFGATDAELVRLAKEIQPRSLDDVRWATVRSLDHVVFRLR